MSRQGTAPARATRRAAVPRIGSLAVMALVLALSACGDTDDADAERAVAPETPDALPAPTRSGGSVTGMPDDPGAGTITLDGAPAAPVPEAPDAVAGAPVAESPDTLPPGIDAPSQPAPGGSGGEVPPAAPVAAAPALALDASAAAATVRDYYQALNARDFGRAHGLWADGGRASGQSGTQFASGFADAGTMDVRVVVPRGIDASTGVPYADVPVRVTTTYGDGSRREFTGRYTLREEGGAWRIATADIREASR